MLGFLTSLVWDQRKAMFQLSGFCCKYRMLEVSGSNNRSTSEYWNQKPLKIGNLDLALWFDWTCFLQYAHIYMGFYIELRFDMLNECLGLLVEEAWYLEGQRT